MYTHQLSGDGYDVQRNGEDPCSIFATLIVSYPCHSINIELLREGVKRSGAAVEDEATAAFS